jgi:hypothetical protein
MYKVVFYTTKSRTAPIKKFLDSSHIKVRAKILRQFKYLQEFGLTPEIPNIKKLKNTPIWELRILGKDNIRIFCAPLSKRNK